jgi:uncharacterized protein
VTIDTKLVEMLACPNCRGTVVYQEAGQVIECQQCHYRYPIREGIPVMLTDEAEKPATR